MQLKNRLLVLVSLFSGVTAVAGGIGLIWGGITPPLEWLDSTLFNSYVGPGLILAIIVGGSSLLAALAVMSHKTFAKDLAGIAGIIMMGWIVGEILLIRQFHWLQVLYFVSGYLATALAWPSDEEYSRHVGRHIHT